MNNTLIIKDADFSNVKVGSLNIQKIEIIKDGNGYMTTNSNGEVIINPDTTDFASSQEYAHSIEIIKPANAKYVFGKYNVIMSSNQYNGFITVDDVHFIPSITTYCLIHSAQTNKWVKGYVDSRNASKPNILNSYSNVYGNNYALLLEGAAYVNTGLYSHLDKIIFNWIRPDAKVCGGIGMEVPELYWGF